MSEKPSGAVTPAWKGASKEGLGGTVSDSGNSQRKGLRRELSLLKEQTEGQCGQTTVGMRPAYSSLQESSWLLISALWR